MMWATDGIRPKEGFFGVGDEPVPAGCVFRGQARFGDSVLSTRDTFGWCPTSATVECDARGPWVREWCKLATWRALNDAAADIVTLRSGRWLRLMPGRRAWHERNLGVGITEPVYRPQLGGHDHDP